VTFNCLRFPLYNTVQSHRSLICGTLTSGQCKFDSGNSFTTSSRVCCFSFTCQLIATLVGLSTAYDVFTEKFKFKRMEVFLVFSLVDNFKQVMKINESKSVIRSIDCIKTLAGRFSSCFRLLH
jgi:hypothetical protein